MTYIEESSQSDTIKSIKSQILNEIMSQSSKDDWMISINYNNMLLRKNKNVRIVLNGSNDANCIHIYMPDLGKTISLTHADVGEECHAMLFEIYKELRRDEHTRERNIEICRLQSALGVLTPEPAIPPPNSLYARVKSWFNIK